jgi:hypothetical protein
MNPPKFICSVEGCEQPRHQYSRQRVKWCKAHASEYYRAYEREHHNGQRYKERRRALNRESVAMARSILREPERTVPIVVFRCRDLQLPHGQPIRFIWRIAN